MHRELAEFNDPRLVAIYDLVCAYQPNTQPDFYLGLAMDLDAERILDVGCGTGLITRNLARLGFTVTGLEPAPLMLERARSRKYGDRVEWIEGLVDAVVDAGVRDQDLAIMTGHVAQFYLTDPEWSDALGHLHAALRPGGTLAFESREPNAREWEHWEREPTNWTLSTGEQLATWTTVQGYSEQLVSCTLHYRFESGHDSGAAFEIAAPSQLRFRTRSQLEASLSEAGFGVRHVYGTWDRKPADGESGELIVVAERH